jgi:hypothetical protein
VRRLALAIVAVVVVVSACGSDGEKVSTTPADEAVGTAADDFDPKNFDATSIEVDNPYLPLVPGTQLTYDGKDVEEGKTTPHRVVTTVTDLVKSIDGVDVVVVWERDFVRDELQEAELSFLAQDTTGTVWHLGEYVEPYDDGKVLIGGQAWMVGHLVGAKAGILMPADPKAGTPSYSEGFAPAPYYWSDLARVDQVGQHTTVPAGTYQHVVVVKEWSEDDPSAIQLKYYAPGVGGVRVGWQGDDEQKETLTLTSVEHLTPNKLAAVRQEALKMETRAYVYGTTPAARPRSPGS